MSKAVKPEITATDNVISAPDVNHLIVNPDATTNAKWYVVHTYSGHETRTANTLKTKVESMGLTDYVYEILIPTQEKIKLGLFQLDP